MSGQTGNACSVDPPKEGECWTFYSNIKLEFHGGLVSQSVLPPLLSFGKGCASISDKDGNLILFTDGMKLYNGNTTLLTSTLDGDLGSTQSSLIVPNPSGNGIYYIFTTHLLYPSPLITKGLNYSTINLNSVTANDTLPVQRLLNQTPEKLTGVRHQNGHDYWVVAHGWGNNSFYSYRVTDAGVDSSGVVVSSVGVTQSGTLASRNSVGYMKLSPDGSKLAQAILGSNLVEWFDFNNATGAVSNVRQIPSPDAGSPYGIEFSSNSQFLYFTTVNPTTNSTNNLYQVDLNAGTAPLLLSTLAHDLTALQLASDGKIYAARYNQVFLSVIENPNRPGTACNLKEDGFGLNGAKSLLGLPNFIQSYFNIPSVTYDTKCMGDDTYFFITNPANIDSVRWDFGDPASGAANTDNLLQPFHVYSSFGTYNATLKEWFNNQPFTTPFSVTINNLPPKSFPEDSIYILPGSAIRLNGGDFMKEYLWQDGSMSQFLEVSKSGYYNVTITDTNCCMQSDTIKILLLDLIVPSAFTPNRDGLNDRFRVKGPTEGIDNYHFYIYNRWGQLIWETNNFTDGWDGTFNGAECPLGVYTWMLQFGVSGNVIGKDKIVKRGVLTLLR